MSDKSIRKALEQRLDLLPPAIHIAHENEQYTPVEGTPYCRAELLPAEPQNPEAGSSPLKVYLGIFQVTLMYPQSAGPGDADTQAEAVRAWYPRGITLVADGISVIIDRTPYRMTGFPDGSRWAVPIRIPYFANITS